MSAEVQQFTFNGSAFRALNDESGESWFSGQDVCNILGTGTNHLREYLDEDEITNIRNTDIAQNGGKAPVFNQPQIRRDRILCLMIISLELAILLKQA